MKRADCKPGVRVACYGTAMEGGFHTGTRGVIRDVPVGNPWLSVDIGGVAPLCFHPRQLVPVKEKSPTVEEVVEAWKRVWPQRRFTMNDVATAWAIARTASDGECPSWGALASHLRSLPPKGKAK